MSDHYFINPTMHRISLSLLLLFASAVYGQNRDGRQAGANYFVASNGSDENEGSRLRPFKTILHAVSKAVSEKGNVVIDIRKGTYYLDQTQLIRAGDFLPDSLQIRAYRDESVFISAGKKLSLQWRYYQNGIYTAKVPEGIVFERLYVNDSLQVLARYPNYDPAAKVFKSTSADAIAPERVKKWKNPSGGYVHALHEREWGGFHYRILGADTGGRLILEGGWQNNRPAKMHNKYRFVENIREELDVPGEWWFDRAERLLYYYPPQGLALQQARIEVSRLKNSIELSGTIERPLKNVELKGLRFVHNERSFWDTREPLLRSDWAIYRGGAVILDGTENCKITDCYFMGIGGNAIMVSNYNRSTMVSGCYIAHIGANAVCFVGNPGAVRSPSFRYEDHVPYSQMDKTPGPLTKDYPAYCTVNNNLFHDLGEIEKQATGVEIEISAGITVSHNTIYNTPRAGINIGDGCFGGHLIAYNDVFNTVLETGDHGAFNSWGRDRFWASGRRYMDSLVEIHPELILLDAQEQTVLKNNRFRCDHGWDIDLDDGSTNYLIYNNVCLNGGLKLREGFFRTVRNNIMINNSFHPHVWFDNSGDVFTNNITMTAYAPIGMRHWGKHIDYNLFADTTALSAAHRNGTDKHSTAGTPMFKNAGTGDYSVVGGSAALNIGFRNFSMDSFGVQKPQLKKIALQPPLPALMYSSGRNERAAIVTWMGASLKSVEGIGERSAYGLPDETGVILMSIKEKSPLIVAGFRSGDVIRSIDGQAVRSVDELLKAWQTSRWKSEMKTTIVRDQQVMDLMLPVR